MNDKEAILLLSKYIDRFRFVAHRLGYLMQGYPENSLENVYSIFESDETLNAIDGIEFDIRFTKDNIPMILHDTRTGDIGNIPFVIEKAYYKDIKNIKCGFRKSTYKSDISWDENKNFNLSSLEDLLSFLMDNRDKLGDKIIKIETKAVRLTK